MKAYERLIKYAKIHTASRDEAATVPSTDIQFDLANELKKEMTEMGIKDVYVDEHAYVYGTIPATPGYKNKPCVGFLAHLDTIPDFSGENVKPRVISNYDGKDIVLGTSGRTITRQNFPHLNDLTGKTLVVTDGTTVLGADDKAGIAEIMTGAEELLKGNIKHGPVAIGFCPDEEVGHGAALMDLTRLGASVAYTLDGGDLGAIEFENFNAAAARIVFHGVNVHPGSAKDVMVNASLLAMEFNSMLPGYDIPSKTEGYEGFFHLIEMKGNVETAQLDYIIRDHDEHKFFARKETIIHIQKIMNEKYGEGTVEVFLKDQYRNMIEEINKKYEVVDKAFAATRACGIEPVAVPVRGGTDGAQLSYRGLPCPNLPTGSYGHHGPYEFAVAEEMESCVELMINIIKEFAK